MNFPESWYGDEVRSGFYVPAIMKRCWAEQLEITGEILDVCRRLDLRCYIGFGTLLGAVRHGGFVPWDDDIDLFMPREDWQSFVEQAAALLPEHYVSREGDFLSRNSALICHVTNTETPIISADALGANHGFPYGTGVDIFPLDHLCGNPELEGQIKLLALTAIQAYKLTDSRKGEHSDWLEEDLRFVEEHSNVRLDMEAPLGPQLLELCEQLARHTWYHKDLRGEDVAVFSYYVDSGISRCPAAAFSHVVMLPFEGIALPAPEDYVTVLVSQFGKDYMTPQRAGGDHSYPCFHGPEGFMQRKGGKSWPFVYSFVPETLAVRERQDDPAEVVGQALSRLRQLQEILRQSVEGMDWGGAFQAAGLCQEAAVELGTALENRARGGMPETVAILEAYCDSIFRLFNKALAQEDEGGTA